MQKPTFYNYGDYSSNNYGVHTLCFVDANNNKYYYSYNTLIAFRVDGEFHIHTNDWGMTTEKHLNWIDTNKDIREDDETFNANLKRLTKGE